MGDADAASFQKPAEAHDRFVGRYSRALAEATIARIGLDDGSSTPRRRGHSTRASGWPTANRTS